MTEQQIMEILMDEIRLVLKERRDPDDPEDVDVWMVKPESLQKAAARIAAHGESEADRVPHFREMRGILKTSDDT